MGWKNKLITKKILDSGEIVLRQINLSDCTEMYVNWLHDPEVNRYLETRWEKQTMSSIKAFVQSQRENDHSILLTIRLASDDKHIGNIKIGPINRHHQHADISYFIGDKEFWGKGIATRAINLVAGFGFHELNLHRVEAGAYAAAVGSWKALEKNNFIREAVFRKQVVSDGEYMDAYRYGLLASEYKEVH